MKYYIILSGDYLRDKSVKGKQNIEAVLKYYRMQKSYPIDRSGLIVFTCHFYSYSTIQAFTDNFENKQMVDQQFIFSQDETLPLFAEKKRNTKIDLHSRCRRYFWMSLNRSLYLSLDSLNRSLYLSLEFLELFYDCC